MCGGKVLIRNIRLLFLLSQPKEQETLVSIDNVLLESVKPESYDLSYACLLIPRLASHPLQSELAEYLPQWMRQICAPYKWWLEFATVDADYFQWGLRVIPSTQTGQFMQVIRQKTSKLILTSFEYIRNESPVNDFWAPGYLVVLGTRPHSKEMIEQYIRMSRRQQGFSPARPCEALLKTQVR